MTKIKVRESLGIFMNRNETIGDLEEKFLGMSPEEREGIDFKDICLEYDEGYGELEAMLMRMETDKEYANRLKYKAELKAEQEAWERDQLAILRAKYGD